MVRAQAVVAQRVGKKGWPCHLSHKGGEAGKSPSRQAPREGAAAQEPVETLDLEPAWWLGGLALQGLPLPESGSLHHSSYKAFHPRSQSAPRRDRAPQPPGAGGGGVRAPGWAGRRGRWRPPSALAQAKVLRRARVRPFQSRD